MPPAEKLRGFFILFFDKSRQFVILELTFMNGGFLMIDILTLNR